MTFPSEEELNNLINVVKTYNFSEPKEITKLYNEQKMKLEEDSLQNSIINSELQYAFDKISSAEMTIFKLQLIHLSKNFYSLKGINEISNILKIRESKNNINILETENNKDCFLLTEINQPNLTEFNNKGKINKIVYDNKINTEPVSSTLFTDVNIIEGKISSIYLI